MPFDLKGFPDELLSHIKTKENDDEEEAKSSSNPRSANVSQIRDWPGMLRGVTEIKINYQACRLSINIFDTCKSFFLLCLTGKGIQKNQYEHAKKKESGVRKEIV